MTDAQALVPIEERQVVFYGDEITAALVQLEERSQIYVPLKPLCDYLGLGWTGQLQRLKRDNVLDKERGMCVIHTPQGVQEMVCLPLELLPGWLFGINSTRVKPELKDKIDRYRAECFKALWQAFQEEALTASPVETSPSIVALQQIREMGLAISRMAEQQIEMEQRLNQHDQRFDNAIIAFRGLERRLGTVERRLTPATLVTEEQAETISATVKALAELLTSQDKSKNFYQSIFGELYRRFGVSSYKNIRIDDYPNVLAFLEDWRKSAS